MSNKKIIEKLTKFKLAYHKTFNTTPPPHVIEAYIYSLECGE